MLSLEQVNAFLLNKLNFWNWENVLQTDREEFLRQLVKKHVCTIYFHNLGLASKEPNEGRVPTEAEILTLGLSGNGGLCNQLNIFIKHVLLTLGFNAISVAGTWSSSLMPGTHCMTIVKMSPEIMYLVDIASGSPNYEPIPLHKLPHKGMAGGYEYEFRLAPDGISYQRIQFTGSMIKGDFKDREEEVRYTFQIKEVSLSDIEPAMTFIYTSPQCYLFTLPFIFRHLENLDAADDEDEIEFILIWGTTAVKGKRNSKEIIKFDTYSQLHESIINNYFPNLDKNTLEVVINKFQQYECIPYRF